ncbi:hypothetical protein PHJA_000608800 [Phtheirospermum japonicum]|uniref:Uncharacterized protein n=1 Tax=Phtheirospermum japonicum TaxID=374723 RepID=A0A830BGY4_9LAMI|nr:hypothetical protein PHJA_000608800 [Phtheirospermum japonicum]
MVVQGLKLKLGSNTVRTDNLRKRIQFIVDQGLRKLGKTESVNGGNSDLSDREGRGIKVKIRIKSLQGEVAIALTDLNDKLNKARNEDDLKHVGRWRLRCLDGIVIPRGRFCNIQPKVSQI